jgi:hypothetical protein
MENNLNVVDIISFIEDPELLNDQSLSPAQKMTLKAIYGLPLTDEELELFSQASGGRKYVEGVEQFEVDIQKGRRSGGTDKILTNIVLYEACMRPPKLSVGEVATSMICTSEMSRQSAVVFNYCEEKLERSKKLKPMIKNIKGGEIELVNGCVVQIFPAIQARVRAPSIHVFCGDEFMFWKSTGVSIDKEVLSAARPGLSFPHSKMILLSSVNRMSGVGYADYKQYFGVDDATVLVLRGSTEFFFPGFPKWRLKLAKLRDPLSYEQEYNCQYRADESSMYDPAQVDLAVNFDRPLELPYRSDIRKFVSFVDVAGGGGRDSYAIAICHKEGEKIVIDLVRSRRPPFNPDETTSQYSDLIKTYHINSVTGDKFSGDWALHSFAARRISYIRSEKSKSELYLNLEQVLNTGQLEIPNKDTLIQQLKSLIRKTHSGSRDTVDSDGGQSEDEANVIAGCAWLLAGPTYHPGDFDWRLPVKAGMRNPNKGGSGIPLATVETPVDTRPPEEIMREFLGGKDGKKIGVIHLKVYDPISDTWKYE